MVALVDRGWQGLTPIPGAVPFGVHPGGLRGTPGSIRVDFAGAADVRTQTMAAKKKRAKAGVEWVGGLLSMPAYVTGEGEPYRPEILLWMIPDGPIIGTALAKPGELMGTAAQHLRDTIERPSFGEPHTPARVRVASPDLAGVLRAGLAGSVEVVCAPTPELDATFDAMREGINGSRHGLEPSYLAPDISASAVASFFRSAATLFRAKPWDLVPSDQRLLAVTIEQLEVRGLAMSVIGQMGQSLGFILFSGEDDFDAYLVAADGMSRGAEPDMPPHFVLNFDREAELPTALRKEIAEHGWEVASPDAYPMLVSVDEDLVARPPTARELTIAEAISLALPKILADREALHTGWSGGMTFVRTLHVKTHAGEMTVTLRAPYQDEERQERTPHDLLVELAGLEVPGQELDSEARDELERELMHALVASPEGKALTDVPSCHFVMDFAANYFGVTIASLGPTELREIIFEIIPRKMSIDASEATSIIQEARALFAFLKRACGLRQADACLRVLGGDAAKRLEAALSDPRNFGMAKSMLMGAQEAGFDVHTEEGLSAWMREVQGRPVPPGILLGEGPTRRADPQAATAKKKKRKAERKARKKSR